MSVMGVKNDHSQPKLLSKHQSLNFYGNFYLFLIFLGQAVKDDTSLLDPDQISHIQSMVAKRGLTNRASVYTHM